MQGMHQSEEKEKNTHNFEKLNICKVMKVSSRREWIAPSAALYFLKNIIENYENFADVLRDVEINIVPVANPDGYKYTFTSVLLTCHFHNLTILFIRKILLYVVLGSTMEKKSTTKCGIQLCGRRLE